MVSETRLGSEETIKKHAHTHKEKKKRLSTRTRTWPSDASIWLYSRAVSTSDKLATHLLFFNIAFRYFLAPSPAFDRLADKQTRDQHTQKGATSALNFGLWAYRWSRGLVARTQISLEDKKVLFFHILKRAVQFKNLPVINTGAGHPQKFARWTFNRS